MKTDLQKPCKECPFRTAHMPGWLGPWDVNELIRHVHHDGQFPCHRSIGTLTVDHPDLQSCAGAVIHMNRSCKRSLDPDHAVHQAALATAPAEIVQSVFEWPHDFVAHHTQDLAEWSKVRKKGRAR